MPADEKPPGVTVESAEPMNPTDLALTTYGTQLVENSISTIVSFSTSLIGWDSGLLTAYLAILKLLNISSISPTTSASPGASTAPINPIFGLQLTSGVFNVVYVIPALIFLVSIGVLVLAVLPHTGTVNLLSEKSIEDQRDKTLKRKYLWMVLGSGLFVFALLAMILVFVSLLL